MLFNNYTLIVCFFITCLILAVILVYISLKINKINLFNFRTLKFKTYECGFLPFTHSQSKSLNSKFILISILFLIFDVEIIFLLPWALNLENFGVIVIFSGLFFYFFLIFGLIYEYKRGIIDWNKKNKY